MSGPIAIDVVSDIICPWCFVGKRRLERALDGIEAVVRWRPFLLDPTIPKQGMRRRDYLEAKFAPERLADLHKPLIAIGEAEGIPFAFDRIAVTPNTRDAHRVLRWAMASDKQNDMAERLFRLYFSEGGNPGDKTELAAAAGEAGLDRDYVAGLLDTDTDAAAVEAEIAHAQAIGITGVPTFIVANRYALVGAQPPETIRDAIAQAQAA